MTIIKSVSDDAEFPINAGESVLHAALQNGLPITHACGGRAKCSTCRVLILKGLENCPKRSPDEAAMAERLRLADEIRLACQLQPDGDIELRRLVLDDSDLVLASQLDRSVATHTGEVRNVAIFFSDVAGFTSLSEKLPPYDTMYLLNRYFLQAGDIIERNGGYIDKFVGDGLMAIFGMSDEAEAPVRSVNAALQTLEAVDRLAPIFAGLYDVDFDVRIGIHYGEAVVGTIGSVGREQITAIGDVVNVASRIEAANKDAGTRLLISDSLLEQVNDQVKVADFVRVRLRGSSERITLHEIEGLTEQAAESLSALSRHGGMRFGGRNWMRAFAEGELEDGAHSLIALDDFDVVVVRTGDGYFAFKNLCPHMHLPLFESRDLQEGDIGYFPETDTPRPLYSTVTEDRGLVCRWHHSCFDLQTGEIRDWATRLQEDGTSAGWEFLGDVSRNPTCLTTYPCRIFEGSVWVALD